MADVPKGSEKKLSQLQMLEQSMQNMMMQKQQFQLQQVEIESALKELEKVDEAYKIIGNIMVLSKKEDLKSDLSSKKEVIELRIKSMEKQEDQLREKASKLQSEVLKEMDLFNEEVPQGTRFLFRTKADGWRFGFTPGQDGEGTE